MLPGPSKDVTVVEAGTGTGRKISDTDMPVVEVVCHLQHSAAHYSTRRLRKSSPGMVDVVKESRLSTASI